MRRKTHNHNCSERLDPTIDSGMKLTEPRNRGQNHERKNKAAVIHGGRSFWLQSAFMVSLMCNRISGTSALDMVYCSNQNTGVGIQKLTDTFQSNGLCYDHCKADYAFAVIQGYTCWCSNYAPGTESSGCDESCPGYGQDTCGNTKKGVYGYIALTNQPSGTMRATSQSTVRSSPTSPSDSPSPPPPPPTSTVQGPTTTVIIISTKSPTPTADSTTPTPTSTTPSPTPTTLSTANSSPDSSKTVVTTINGYKTIVISQSEQAVKASKTPTQQAAEKKKGFFSHPGRVAGLFIGLALIIIGFVAGLLFFCYRRNHRRNAPYDPSGNNVISAGGAGILSSRRRSRSASTLGLVGEKGMLTANTTPETGPNSTGTTAGGSPEGPRIIDQRLDPGLLYMRFEHDVVSSRNSVRSLRDDTDYSRRVLRLANPDQ